MVSSAPNPGSIPPVNVDLTPLTAGSSTDEISIPNSMAPNSMAPNSMALPPNQPPILDAPPLADLRYYDQSWFKRGRPGWVVLLWWFVQAIAFPITPHSLHAPRRFLLKLFGARIGRGVVIRPTARFTFPWKIDIGDYSWIGDDVVLYSLDQIQIGQHCIISQKSYLCTGSHDIGDPTFRLQTAPIKIGNGVWIASDCFIAPGVQIGANTVVGARSSVFSNLPAQQICKGTPCRPCGTRTLRIAN